jgi:hypothetical protein
MIRPFNRISIIDSLHADAAAEFGRRLTHSASKLGPFGTTPVAPPRPATTERQPEQGFNKDGANQKPQISASPNR